MSDPVLHFLILVGAPLLCYAGYFYLVVPAAVKGHLFFLTRPTYVPASPDGLPPAGREYVGRVAGHLAAVGFVPVVSFRNDPIVADLTHFKTLFVNRPAGDLAAVSVSFATAAGNGAIRATMIEFQTEFLDGPAVETNNAADGSAFPPNPSRRRLSLPGAEDVGLLYDVHRGRRARLSRRPPPPVAVLPVAGGEVEHVADETAAELAFVAAAGYFRLDEAAGVYRKTWRGTYLMTWKQLFPVKQVRRALGARLARAELAAVGVDPARLDTAPAGPPGGFPMDAVPAEDRDEPTRPRAESQNATP